MKSQGQFIPISTITICLFTLLLISTGCTMGQLFAPAATLTPESTFTFTPSPPPTGTPTLTSTPTQTSTPTPTPPPSLTVLADQVKLRSGPGENYPIVATASTGESLILLGKNYEETWLFILTPVGEEAWVEISQVDLSGISLMDVWENAYYPEPPPVILGWQGDPVQDVCLKLEGTYVGTFARENPARIFGIGNPDYDEIEGEIRSYFSTLGLRIMNEGEQCQATFAVDLTIDQLSSKYSWGSTTKTCYTGVSISSEITFSDGKNTLRFNPNKRRPISNIVMGNNCQSNAIYAPESLFVVLTAMDKLWSQALALPLSNSSNTATRYYVFGYVLDTIRGMGSSGRVFTAQVIEAYENYHYPTGTVTCDGVCPTPQERWLRTMTAITGKNFEYDIAAWREWWQLVQPTPAP